MANEALNETLAEIVAEMRKRMKSYYYSREGRNLMRQYADRIEAVARRETAAAWIEGYDHAKRDPNAVKTGDMLLAENERMRKALADTAENLRVHLQIPTQTISMNRLEVEAMARDCEKALGEDGHGEAKAKPSPSARAIIQMEVEG